MSKRLEMLERLVNSSNLTTQRVTHCNVIKIGGCVLSNVEDDKERRFLKELEEAVAHAEARAEREKQQALLQLRRLMEQEKERAMNSQKQYFQELAKRVAEMRDKLEAEKMDELKEKMEEEKKEALRLQWEEALQQQAKAVERACAALTKKLNREHKLDKEMSIAESLRRAREGFKRRLAEALDENTRKCQEIAAEEARVVAQLHSDEIQRHNIRYNELKSKYTDEHAHRQRVESDFNGLQTDYQRFMNYTDGKYHSDYMMQLRRHGMVLSEKRLSDVSEYQEKQIKDILLPRLGKIPNTK